MAASLGIFTHEITSTLTAPNASGVTGGSGIFQHVLASRLLAVSPLIGIGSGIFTVAEITSSLSAAARQGETGVLFVTGPIVRVVGAGR